MDVQKIRELLGEKSEKMTDGQVIKIENNMRILARIMVDKIWNLTPEERKKLNKVTKIREHIDVKLY